MKVLFLLPYPIGKAPSQRFRVENLLPLLDEAGISYALHPFMDDATWQVLYKGGSLLQKARGIAGGFFRRLKTILFEARQYDRIFIHREASPLGPPVFEWILKKIFRKKIIFDFDDAIWIPNTSSGNKIAAAFKAHWKTRYICRWSYRVSAGNDFLCRYAIQSGAASVVKIPTVVDMERRYNQVKEHHTGSITIGWTGSHSTLKYLDDLIPVIREVQKELDCTFLVIADKKPDLPLTDWHFIPWDPATEIEDLLRIDVGVMPLTADPWSEGKCGFKLIQYLSLGIPAVASPVGVNKDIIDHGVNGYLADSRETWLSALRQLISDTGHRTATGMAGYEKMTREYSVASLRASFLSLFK